MLPLSVHSKKPGNVRLAVADDDQLEVGVRHEADTPRHKPDGERAAAATAACSRDTAWLLHF